jgi:Trm5-related predicted tRNA methylase
MKTTNNMNSNLSNIHLTINTFPETSLTTSSWSLFGGKEPQRIAVRFNNKEYVIVLDEAPYFEVWSLDEKGELLDCEATLKRAADQDFVESHD